MRTVIVAVGALAVVVLAAGGDTLADAVASPRVVMEGGLVSSALPSVEAGLSLGVAYESDTFVASSETTVTVLPDFLVYEEASASLSPGDIEIGLDVGFGIVPLGIDTANVWAGAPFYEKDVGGDTPIYLTADAFGTLWLGDPFGGAISVGLEAEFPGQSVTATMTSVASVTYDAVSGLGLEEDVEARFASERSRVVDEGPLTGRTRLVGWTRIRLRLDASGFSVPRLLVGLGIRIESPVRAKE